jgi:hypothetical protein
VAGQRKEANGHVRITRGIERTTRGIERTTRGIERTTRGDGRITRGDGRITSGDGRITSGDGRTKKETKGPKGDHAASQVDSLLYAVQDSASETPPAWQMRVALDL